MKTTDRAAIILAVLAAAVPSRSNAQTGSAAADSAAAARIAWRDATQTTRVTEAIEHLRRAARAWPEQPAYWTALAIEAGAAGDSTLMVQALDVLTEMGAGGDIVERVSSLEIARSAMVRSALARFRTATMPFINSTRRATLDDTAFFAEGIVADARTGNLYVTSIRQRTVVEIDPNGRQRDLHIERNRNVGSILAARVANDRAHLWLTTGGNVRMSGFQPADSALAALLKVRISDGTIVDRYDLPVGQPHIPGDLAVTRSGDVYVSDSRAPVIYVLRSGSRKFESITDPLFRSLQGIAMSADDRSLYLADYSHGLLHVEVNTHVVTRLVNDHAHTTTLGLDGIVLHANAIIGVQNGLSPSRIVRFSLDAGGKRISRVEVLDRNPLADEPTAGTLVGGRYVYVANSQWEKYESDGSRRLGKPLRSTILLQLELAANDTSTAR